MCGIFSLLNNVDHFYDPAIIKKQFDKIRSRGPEFSSLQTLDTSLYLGFHRLAINGLNQISNQPIVINDIYLICNGEIYNHNELFEIMNVERHTQSDCEVIIHLYLLYGMEQTLKMLDGVFSFLLIDKRKEINKLFVGRDPYGVRPLYVLTQYNNKTNNTIYGFASEVKSLIVFKNKVDEYIMDGKIIGTNTIDHFKPGTFSYFELDNQWKVKDEFIPYHSTPYHTLIFGNESAYFLSTLSTIQNYLFSSVEKRCFNTDRKVACLLSGGLDSSLITSFVKECLLKIDETIQLETYSIGLAGSEDLKYAKIVANYLQTKHTEIVVTEQDFIDTIPEVIYAIESYDTTTVRASIGNYLLGKYISQHSDAKVIFNGDGSDELCGGYLYMYKCGDAIEFDKECKRLLADIHKYDVLRSDRCISSHGLEPRTPFLDRFWVQFYLSIDLRLRFHVLEKHPEKYLLRTAFSREHFTNHKGEQLLPDEVLWRTKEAFSDGVSKNNRSLYVIINEYLNKHYENGIIYNGSYFNEPITIEQKYYRSIYDKHYSGCEKLVPYFWMPKYVNATDASARTLDIYKELNVAEV